MLPYSNSSKTQPRTRQWHFRHRSLSLVLIHKQETDVKTLRLWRSPPKGRQPSGRGDLCTPDLMPREFLNLTNISQQFHCCQIHR